MEGKGRKNKKKYFQGGAEGKRPFQAQDGHKGVLVTCARHQEAQCVRETFSLLNEYADQLYPEEHQEAQEDVGTADAELAKEIAALTRKNKEGTRRFYCLDTGVKGLILIRFTEGRMEPVAFMTHILNDLSRTKAQKTKAVVRFIPVEKTCVVQLDKILEVITTLTARHFKLSGKPHTYCVMFKARHNSTVQRMECINGIARVIGSPHKVDLNNPEIVIIVEIFQRACGICVIPKGDYHRLAEFNIRRLCESDGGEGGKGVKRKKERKDAQIEEKGVETKDDTEKGSTAEPGNDEAADPAIEAQDKQNEKGKGKERKKARTESSGDDPANEE